jgi:hypothetical protein
MTPRLQDIFIWQSHFSIAPPRDPTMMTTRRRTRTTRRTKTASRRLLENQTKTNRFDR